MGVIHSRAAKKRDRAEAELLREQAKQARGSRVSERRADQQARQADADERDLPAWRQPAVGGMIRRLADGKRDRQQ